MINYCLYRLRRGAGWLPSRHSRDLRFASESTCNCMRQAAPCSHTAFANDEEASPCCEPHSVRREKNAHTFASRAGGARQSKDPRRGLTTGARLSKAGTVGQE